MSTPRKKFNNYNSPYKKPVQQYPSQSVDYISLDMGGLAQASQETPAGYTNTQYFQNSNSKSNRGKKFYNSGNRPNQYMQQDRYTPRKNNEYHQHKQYTPRKNGYQQQEHYTPRKNNDSFQNRQNHNASPANSPISEYCHPTMTEDPWMELMERVHALERSKISIKNPTTTNNTDEGDVGDKNSNE